jgi:hypothetical protein
MAVFRMRARHLGVFVFVVLATAVAVALYTSKAHATEVTKTPRMSGAQLADAILFHDGPAAKYLTRTGQVGRPDVRTQEVEQQVNSMFQTDQSFSSRFAADIQGGDRQKVRNALNDLGQRVRSILDKVYGAKVVDGATVKAAAALNTSTKDSPVSSPNDTYLATQNVAQIDIDIEVAAALALDLALVLVVLVAITLIAAPTMVNSHASLAVDQYVNSVAADLAA